MDGTREFQRCHMLYDDTKSQKDSHLLAFLYIRSAVSPSHCAGVSVVRFIFTYVYESSFPEKCNRVYKLLQKFYSIKSSLMSEYGQGAGGLWGCWWPTVESGY